MRVEKSGPHRRRSVVWGDPYGHWTWKQTPPWCKIFLSAPLSYYAGPDFSTPFTVFLPDYCYIAQRRAYFLYFPYHAHLRPERRLGGVWPDASGEQKDAGGGKVPHRSVLRCGGCCDRRTVRNGDPAAYRNDTRQDTAYRASTASRSTAASQRGTGSGPLPGPFCCSSSITAPPPPSGTALPGNWRSWIKTPSSAVG